MSDGENYFTAKNLRKKAEEMLSDLRLRPEVPGIAGSETALLVVDMQEYFTSPLSHAWAPAAEAIIPVVKSAVGVFKSAGAPVVFTRHLNNRRNSGSLGRWWKDLVLEKNPLSRIDERVPSGEGKVLVKTQYDAFYKTGLDSYLRKKGVENVLVCGVLTHLCCETTARSAFVRNYNVFFAVDGTATYNEDFHRATLLNLCHGFAKPVILEDLFGKEK